MKSTRRSAKLGASFAAAALILAACSSGSDGDSDSDATTAETTDSTAETGGSEAADTTTADTSETTESESTEAESTDAPGTTAAGGDTGTASGVVAYADAQEFGNYNNNLATANSVKNAIVINEVLPSPYNFAGPDGALVRDENLTDSIEVLSEDPLQVEYVVNADAVWSDGDPIDCDDFYLQYIAGNGTLKKLDDSGNVVVDEEGNEAFLFETAGTTGYEQMESLECSPDGKTITVNYGSIFADWQSMFDEMVPAHIVEAQSGVEDIIAAYDSEDRESLEAAAEFFNTAWSLNPGEIKTDIMPSGGRLAITAWEAGSSLTLSPNPNYWADPAKNEGVVIRYIAEEAQSQALANGEVNAMSPQPSPDLIAQLEGLDGVTVETSSTYIYEHFDFNFRNETLQDIKVRQAFAMCVPRQQMVDNLIKPVYPDAVIQNNRWVFPFEEGYADATNGQYDVQDIEGAQALLQEAGAEGVELRIGWFDNGGNQRRTDQVALTIEACNQAGFNLVDAGSEDFFDGGLDSGEGWDIAMFAWAGSPLRTSNSSTFETGAGNNNGAYTNPEVDALIDQLKQTIDIAEQTEISNQIDALIWEDLATIPLFTFPGATAYTDNVSGVVNNPSQNGLTWNASQWQLS